MVHEKIPLSVVVPVYNSEASLKPLVARLAQALGALATEFELVLVNDGSRDRSWSVVQELAREHAWVRGIDMSRNYGQHNAILCGIRAARHPVVVTMDDDLQHPPEEIAKLLATLAQGFDVVYGTPHKQRHGLLRDLASQMTKMALQKSMGAETAGKVSAFRALRTRLRDAFADYRGSFVSIDVLLTWATTRFSSVEVRHDPREHGTSNYTYKKLFTHALNMITGFSVLPLQIASAIGFTLTLIGLFLIVYVVYVKIVHGIPVQGYASLASMIAIFSGAQLFALGIMGEYLARMHFRMMDRPTYAVRETIGAGSRPRDS
jgi:undecaprenyl-phosphate 4-deoxy-4-formamido-L-arabinose transferase